MLQLLVADSASGDNEISNQPRGTPQLVINMKRAHI